MAHLVTIPNLGSFDDDSGLVPLARCSDGLFEPGRDGVLSITATGDRKVEFVAFQDHTLAYVTSAMGYPAYYPLHPVSLETPVTAVLMDLDGTSVRSEGFWIWIIQQTVAGLLGDPGFELQDEDLPFVSGHSVSEHLAFCLSKYCPDRTVEEARSLYFQHTRREMQKIMAGGGRTDAFSPAPGLREFLVELKDRGISLGLVSSGLYEKAYPEILAAFRTMGLGSPEEFYDVIITAGFPLGQGSVGTLGELAAKPHPWLYAEAFRVGLGMGFQKRNRVLGIEDSGAGVCAIRLAGLPTVGIGGGNILESGTRALCHAYCESLVEVLDLIGSSVA
ncbi:MAG TPA: HAD family phosphatase [Anaerolineae bacterium]|nr:HAD family phosphatase [Anaerolineae bacterium]